MSSPGRNVSEGLALALEVFLAVVGGLDGKTDAALGLVDLDHARFHVLAHLEKAKGQSVHACRFALHMCTD